MKAKSVGKGATLITLMSNPVVRRAVIKGANKAMVVGSNKLAARSEKKASAAASSPMEGQTTVIPKPASKPASFGETAAIESIVTSVTSAARPYVDKLAASDAGRSVLQVVNSVTGQALGGADSQPRRGGGAAVASFVGNILSGQGNSGSSPKPEAKGPGSDVTYTQVKPPAATADSPAPKTIQWPPPKPNGSGS